MAVPDPGDASYPPHVPARKRATVTPPLPEVDPNEVGPNGHGPAIEALLKGAVEEAARLLDTDGAMVYLLDPETQILRFGFDAGIHNERTRRWLRRIRLPIGTGMVGRAVADRAVVITDDYVNDDAFPHAPDPDRVVEDVGIRSMVVAPLVSGDQVFGALGTFSTRTSAFNPAQIALVRSLADHAAASMANVRLIADLDRSRRELSQRAEIERSLREIAARISSASDLDSVLQRTVDEASRLIHADGAILDVLDTEGDVLRWAFDSGLSLLFSARRARRPVDRARRRGDRSRAGREPGDRRGRRPRRGVSEVVTVRPLLRPDGVPIDDRGTDRRRRRPARRPRGVFAPSERLRRG